MHCDESDDPLSRHIETLAFEAQRIPPQLGCTHPCWFARAGMAGGDQLPHDCRSVGAATAEQLAHDAKTIPLEREEEHVAVGQIVAAAVAV